jgi:hypothetical protein
MRLHDAAAGRCGGAAQRQPFVSVVFAQTRLQPFARHDPFGSVRVKSACLKTAGRKRAGIADGIPALLENGLSVFTTIITGATTTARIACRSSCAGASASRTRTTSSGSSKRLAEKGVKEDRSMGRTNNSYCKGSRREHRRATPARRTERHPAHPLL